MRRQGQRAEMRQLFLVRAVIVHLPDFLVSAARAYIVDMRLRDTLNAAAQPEDDFVRKSMCDEPRVSVARLLAVLLAEHLWRLRIFDVIKPALDVDIAALYSEVAEGEHAGARRRAAPFGQHHILRCT